MDQLLKPLANVANFLALRVWEGTGFLLKESYDEFWFVKKCQNHTFKSIFYAKNQWNFFKKEII